MYLSVNNEASPAVTRVPAPGKSDAWDLASIGLCMLDGSLQVTFSNPHLQNLLACTEQQLAGRNLLQFLDIDNYLRSCIINELSTKPGWQGLIHKSGRVLRIEISRTEASGSGHAGSDSKYSAVVLDYSADYKKLRELSSAKALAEKTDKAKSRFLSHMSHELRTPLNAILGFSQLMKIEEGLSAVQQDNLKEIEAAGTYLLTLINEILDLSRIESGKIKLSEDTVYLEQLLAECLTLVKPIADKKNISLECELTTERQLHTDHVRLKQVIVNLLSNAIKYNTENGCVVLHCHDIDEHNIRIEIQDSGTGIAPDVLNHIFSPFERLGADDKTSQHSGLGLMISRRLTRLMSGTIDVLSEPGRGSVFWLELPAVSLDEIEFHYFHEAAASRVSYKAETGHVTYVGESAAFAALLQRIGKIREKLLVQTFTGLAEARAELAHASRGCVFVSAEIARQMAQQTGASELPRNLNLIVIKDQSYSEKDPAFFRLTKAQLPASFTLTDVLKIIDNSFSDGF